MYAGEFVRARIEAIKALRVLQKTVDPASGMSVCVRRGVLRDDPEDEDRRPWTRMEICDHMDGILELLIDGQTQSLRQWVKSADRDSARLAKAAEDGRAFLGEAS